MVVIECGFAKLATATRFLSVAGFTRQRPGGDWLLTHSNVAILRFVVQRAEELALQQRVSTTTKAPKKSAEQRRKRSKTHGLYSDDDDDSSQKGGSVEYFGGDSTVTTSTTSDEG